MAQLANKELLVELLTKLPSGRLERLVRISSIQLRGSVSLPLVERAATADNVAFIAADLNPEQLPGWAVLLGIDPTDVESEALRDRIIDYIRLGPPTNAGTSKSVIAAVRAGSSAKSIAELIDARGRQLGEQALSPGERRLKLLLGLAVEGAKFGAGAGQVLAFVAYHWPDPLLSDLLAVGAPQTAALLREWHTAVLGEGGAVLRGESLFVAAAAASNDSKFDPSAKHRRLWKERWASRGEDIISLALADAATHPESFADR